jgi:hypothetical protein
MSYTAPVKDMLFNIKHLANIDQVAQIPGFEDAGFDTAQAVLEECAKLNEGVIAPLNWDGDKNPSSLEGRRGHHHARLQGCLQAVRRRRLAGPAAPGGLWRPGPAQDHWRGLR